MAHTIHELERLLEEAVNIAQMAGTIEEQSSAQPTTEERPISPTYRPSQAIAVKVDNYLRKASVASSPSSDSLVRRESSGRRRRTASHLEPPPPLPTAEHSEARKATLSRSRKASAQTTSPCKHQHAEVLGPPQVGPRTTSSRNPRDKRRSSASRQSPPVLRLNSVDLVEGEDEEKDHFLGKGTWLQAPRPGHERHFTQMFGIDSRQASINMAHGMPYPLQKIDLNGVRHVDVPDSPDDFDVHQTCNHAPIARNWPDSRKRWAALGSCVNTACLGFLIGIYSGEVPAIQYVIVDFDRRMILGNVFLYCGLAIPTLVFWPLPLLHGRKPYNIAALALTLCLQIPQGLAVNTFRTPDVRRYRILLLVSRALSGVVFGFANINNLGTLLDCFGASLKSSESNEDLEDPLDIRRHGGGMGVWLAVWSWCTMGSIALGFVVGAFIISGAPVDWGFWVSSMLLMVVLLLNIIAPEVRRSAFRRTMAEMLGEGGSFSRVARGEVKMHLTGNGPYWWGEEVLAGLRLNWKMVKQPGFLVLSIYAAWVYAQFTLVLMLLGALASTRYRYRPVDVGLCVLSLGIGSIIAIPFQKASWLSRARYLPPRTNSMTLESAIGWTSHTLRRTLWMVFLPLAAIGYALTSKGPVFPVAVPCLFAGLVGYASVLGIGECYALMMQTFDTSDLQPGMTGRPARQSVVQRYRQQRTNFSCYPRISAGIAVTQFLKFVFGAVSTGICGRLERRYGAMQAAGIVAGVLLVLTLLVVVVLVRWRKVQMTPSSQDRDYEQHEGWEPVVLGDPGSVARKISLLEAGDLTRWSEIRRRNRLEIGLTRR
ncbi:hypothetical protein A1O1_07290 [Capronia coronata CBS 617.96]|uniref:Major facilitator superfamily (MFS) profile domain-containing protein n=1 Tax=Capronia coronata CBS 617.96 TaxID=1182541 RepID=W9Y343_9EURO|nr:uncharacterized protein A1O1_07290 [Capronia coronata CBS 617.96]EXJ83666.1 hypothetical protein A1O1_07290 [Capronia coronata CBS 617.96]